MEITAREAARRLGEHHLLSRDLARRVLSSGLAGPARRTPSALLYQEAMVDALLARPMCPPATLDAVRPFIARLGRGRRFSLGQPWEEQAEVVCGRWYIPHLTRVAMILHSPLGSSRCPFVATLGGWVVFGAEITGMVCEPMVDGGFQRSQNRTHPPSRLCLEMPGAWFDDLRDTWLPIENGPTWTLWGAATTTRTRLDSLRADFLTQAHIARSDRLASSLPVLRAAAREDPPQPTEGPIYG